MLSCPIILYSLLMDRRKLSLFLFCLQYRYNIICYFDGLKIILFLLGARGARMTEHQTSGQSEALQADLAYPDNWVGSGSAVLPKWLQSGSYPVWSPGSVFVFKIFSNFLDNWTNIYWISSIWLFRLKDVDIDWERGKFLGIRSGFCKSQSGSANLRHDLYPILGKNTRQERKMFIWLFWYLI